MAFRLLSCRGVENEARDWSCRNVGGRAARREDRADAILRWLHRLLNPRTPAPAMAPSRRRVRDRVPI
jgi:hypothetical protein